MTGRTGPCSHRVYVWEGEEKTNQERKEDSRCFPVPVSGAKTTNMFTKTRNVVMGWRYLGLGAGGRCFSLVVWEASWRR